MNYLVLLGVLWFAALIVTAANGHHVGPLSAVGLMMLGALTGLNMFLERRKTEISPGSIDRLEERLSRIQEQLDSVAIEVERIGEGQRFLTKLGAERVRPALQAGEPDADGARRA
jgi:hypothetical protein